ncbi:MAG: alpha/beta fold hydrolase [Streptosporangiales bacterium]|nr:alpha/beta fold hydrolase [Streptosporangiales bacterium]MBO0890114.1 alpha/beta fold hydrolase [Acidothermales bacterium]
MDQRSEPTVLPEDAGAPALAYVDRGPRTGAAVVLLHSLGTDLRMWRPQLDELAACHRVVAVDSRGHGGSGWRPDLSVDAWVDDLGRLLDHSGVTTATFVGVSMGGVQGLAFALRHPDRTAGLVLADTFAELAPDVASAKIAAMSGLATELGMAAYADSYVADTFTSKPIAADAELVRDAIATTELEPYVASVRTCFGVRLGSRLAEVTAPTLVLWGDRDAKTPRELSEQLAAGIPGATLRVLPKAGHLSNLENPRAFLDAVAEHLDSLAVR